MRRGSLGSIIEHSDFIGSHPINLRVIFGTLSLDWPCELINVSLVELVCSCCWLFFWRLVARSTLPNWPSGRLVELLSRLLSVKLKLRVFRYGANHLYANKCVDKSCFDSIVTKNKAKIRTDGGSLRNIKDVTCANLSNGRMVETHCWCNLAHHPLKDGRHPESVLIKKKEFERNNYRKTLTCKKIEEMLLDQRRVSTRYLG